MNQSLLTWYERGLPGWGGDGDGDVDADLARLARLLVVPLVVRVLHPFPPRARARRGLRLHGAPHRVTFPVCGSVPQNTQ